MAGTGDPQVFTCMDNAYLAEVIGKPLTQCLTELTEKQPRDPVEWIAYWLYKFADNELYLFEKAKYLELCALIFKKLEAERRAREKNKQLLARTLMDAMVDAAKYGVLLNELGLSGPGSAGSKGRLQRGLYGGSQDDDDSTFGDGRSKGRGKGRRSQGGSVAVTALSTWGVNCRLGLVCQHPILGDIEPRPPLLFPETPEWWERQNYIPETLYDPEIYSRENDDTYANWNNINHMTYKDFIEPGPWLNESSLGNMQNSLQDIIRMPKKFKKHVRPVREGDYFPETAREQRKLAIEEALELAENATFATQPQDPISPDRYSKKKK